MKSSLFQAAVLLVAILSPYFLTAEDSLRPVNSSDGSASATTSAPVEAAPVAQRVQGRSGFFERVQPRPLETPEQLAIRTQSLKSAYSRPPADWPSPKIDAGVNWVELGLMPRMLHPPENPYSRAKAHLGRALFFDPRLSKTNEMACASCHDPDLAWADGRTVSFGLGRTELKRNAPSIMNLGHLDSLFWDGRAGSLEDQAEQVLMNPQEMACSEELLLERIASLSGYQAMFLQVFGDSKITLDRVAQAVACFERTINGGRSDFDNFMRGNYESISDSALRGLDLFRTDARCLNCHHGAMLTDQQFHDIGLSYYGRKYEDLGRYRVTSQKRDVGSFRTPSLRNVGRTQPYMHNGLFGLSNVLRMYNSGMPTLVPREEQKGDELFPAKSPLLKPLGLNRQDLEDLEAFLESLGEPPLRHRPPEFDANGPVPLKAEESDREQNSK